MIEEQAQVVAVDDQFAWVETQRKSTCGSCAASKGCGTATLAKILGNKRSRVRVINNHNVAVGDEVIVGIDEAALVRGSLAVYAAPLAAMLIGAGIGDLAGARWAPSLAEAFSLGFGLGGLAAGLLWVRWFGRRIGRDPRFQPVIVRKLGPLGVMHNAGAARLMS